LNHTSGWNQPRKPWVNEKGEVIWPWFRVWIACIVRSQTFESLMGVVILANVALIVYETNADAACYPEFLNDLASCPHASGKMFWTFVSNVVLQVIYTTECTARGYAERAGFFRNRWNLLDLFIATGCKRFHFCVIFTFHVYSRNVICFMVFFGEPHCGSVKPSGDYWMVRHGSNGTGESQRAAHLSRHSLVEGRSFADHCAGTLHFSQRSCNIHEGRLPRADW